MAPSRGILRAPRPDGLLDGRRILPSEEVATHVHHFWWVRWSLRSPYTAEALLHPSAQITHVDAAGERRAELVGVHTQRLARRLVGEGQTFGITFRPVMFQPLLAASMASLTDRTVPLDQVLGPQANAWTQAIHEAGDVDDKIAITEAFLGPLLPRSSPRLVRLRDLVERMAVDRSILRVEDVAAESGLDRRALQRCFQTYVGVSPKSVIQRYRLHEAAMQLQGAHPPALAALAASLGYADQAHFARDFKRAVGQTPLSFGRSGGSRPAR
ncbi:MAG: helix-turn-helix transcriptional regulator [Byssovorax sp.]